MDTTTARVLVADDQPDVYGVLLRPLPFLDAGALVYTHDTNAGTPVASMSWEKFVALRDGRQTLSSMAVMTPVTLTLTRRGEPQRLQVMRVSGDFFTVLAVAPLAGRTINRADDVPNANPTCAALLALTIGASFIPARRMMRVDPAVALRAE